MQEKSENFNSLRPILFELCKKTTGGGGKLTPPPQQELGYKGFENKKMFKFLIFKLKGFRSRPIQSKSRYYSPTLKCKDIGIRKSEFVK